MTETTQSSETGDEVAPGDDGITPVIENPDEQNENGNSKNPKKELADESTSKNDPSKDDADDTVMKINAPFDEIVDEDETAEVIIKGVSTSVSAEGTTTNTLTDKLTTAEILFTNGCASEDGKTVRKETNLTFLVLPNDGYSVSNVYFAAADAEEGLTLEAASTLSGTPGTSGGYSINASDVTGKKVLIAVATTEIKYTLSASDIPSNGEALKVVKADGTLAAITGEDAVVNYSKANSITLALVDAVEGETYTVNAKAAGDTGAGTNLTAGSVKTVGETSYIPYALNVSALGSSVAKNADQQIDITVAQDSVTTVNAQAATITANVDSSITVFPATVTEDGTKLGYVAYQTSNTYRAGQQVVFQVARADDSKYAPITKKDITAKLTKGGETDIPLTVGDAPKTGVTIDEGNAGYVVVLSKNLIPEDGYALNIEIKTELDAAKSKTITFIQKGAPASAGAVAKITTGTSDADATTELPATNRVRTEGNAIWVKVASQEGYQMTSVNVTVKGTLTNADGTKASYNNTYILDENPEYGKEDKPDEKSNYPRYQVSANIPLIGTIDATTTEAAKDWVAESVTVEVVVSDKVEGADEQKAVTFESTTVRGSGDGVPYKFEIKEIEEKDEDGNVTQKVTVADDVATIEEGTQYLEFSVEAARDPKAYIDVKPAGGAAENDLLESLNAADGKYSFRVPAKAMLDGAKIVITRPQTTIALDSAVTGFATAEFRTTETPEQSGSLSTTITNIDLDAPVEVTVRPDSGHVAPITSVTYKVGANGEEKTVTANSEGEYVFTETASDAIVVKVESGEEEKLFLQRGDAPAVKIDPNAQYEVDYQKAVTVWLTQADGSTSVAIINAMITENGKLAQTKAAIDSTTQKATFTIDKTEYGKVLTVTLVKADRTKVSFEVVSDEAASDITYKMADGTPVDGSVALNADTAIALNVGSELGNLSKIYVDVIDTPASAPEKVDSTAYAGTPITDENENIKATLTNGVLTITAKAKTEKLEKAGTIVLWAAGSDDVLKGSVLDVSVNDPIIKSQTASIDLAGATGRSFTVKFNNLNEMKAERLAAGKLGFMVKMAALPETAPEGIEAAQWAQIKTNAAEYTTETGRFVALNELEADGWTIQMIRSEDAPVKVEGIKITATPVQFTDKNDAVATALADTAKHAFGTASEELEAHTTEPIYSDTLKLGSGANTLTTGMNADIVVATPVFSKEAKYVDVKTEIINSSTGKTHGYAGNFAAKWYPANGTVTVNASSASYANNASGNYKDLAIKITAFTENGDYGVSAVKKLSVVNGIQNMTVTVQPEILKQTAKKVTAKTTVAYNTTSRPAGFESKCDPKKKAVTYAIVDAGAKIKGNVEIAKNGTITIAKDYIPTGSDADNSFKVRVYAADYAGNSIVATSGNILITTKEPALGRLAVLEKDGIVWKETSGDLQVKTAEQYKLVMFKDGVQRVSYSESDLNVDGTKDILAYANYTIKSSNKNIVVDSVDGNITVKKLGKATFTMSPKSKAKPNSVLKNVNFVAEKTDLYVRVVQYSDSTFDKVKKDYYCNANSVITANDNTTNYFSIQFMKKVADNGDASDYADFTLANQNTAVTFKNAKKVTPVNKLADKIYFAATGGTDKKATVVKVNNKMVKPAKAITITINNETVAALAKAAAPKIAMAEKLSLKATSGSYPVKMNVTPANKKVEIESGTYIMLSADQTKKYKADINDVFDGYLDTPILLDHKSNSLSQFTLGVKTVQNVAESYTLIATLGTMDNGVFVQTFKEARITVKTTKANANIKVTNKYTLNPYGISTRKLDISSDYHPITLEKDDPLGTNYAENMILKNGVANHFTDYFEVTKVEPLGEDAYYQIGIKADADLAKLADPKSIKDDLTGYVTITNTEKIVDIKLVITVKGQKDLKLSAKASDVIEGTNVVTDIQVLDGKEPLVLEDYSVTSAAGFTKYYTEALATNADEANAETLRKANGIIRVTAPAASKNAKVDLVVLPKKALESVIKKDDKPNYANGITIKGVNIKVNKKSAKNKVNVADKKWIVAPTDWKLNPETVEGNTVYGWEKVEISYTFKSGLNLADGHKITVDSNADYVKFSSDEYDKFGIDGQKLTIFVDKAKLQAAIAAAPKKVNWNKTVKVKATFSYDVAATDTEEAVVTGIAKDDVTFNITLPANPAYEVVNDLYKEVKESAEKGALRKLAESKTKEYGNVNTTATANRVAADLTEAIQKMAKGTSTTFGVTGTYSDPTYTYTITVPGKSNITITVGGDITATTVAAYIDETYNKNNPSYVNATATDALKLSYYPAFTTDSELVAALTNALMTAGKLTNNISLTAEVSKNASDTHAPTTSTTGLYTASIVVTDNSVEPYAEGYQNDDAKVVYVFNQLTNENTTNGLLDIGGTAGLQAALNTKYKDDGVTPDANGITRLEYLFSEAERLIGAEAIKDGVVSDAMVEKLIELIVADAKKLLETNAYLDVEGIDKNTFMCDYDDTTSGSEKWDVSFAITYIDNTPNAAQKTVLQKTANNALAVRQSKVPSQRGSGDLKTAAEAAFAACSNIIGYVDTEEAAIAAIEDIIKGVNANPNYDPAKSLKVRKAENGQFIAPTVRVSGKIDVEICYNLDAESPDWGRSITFTIAKASDMDEDTGKVKDDVVADVRNQYKERVQAYLTQDVINKIVKDVWNDETTPAPAMAAYKSSVQDAIEEAVKDVLDTTNSNIDVVGTTPVTVESIANPASTQGVGTIKNIVIKLRDTDSTRNTAGEWEAAYSTITISSMALLGDPVFQSEAEFIADLKKALTETGLAYSADFVNAWDAEAENEDKEAAQTAIKDAIKAVATSADNLTPDLKVATNPEWKADAYTGKIEVTVDAADADYKAGSVGKVSIKFNKDVSGKENTTSFKNQTVKIRAEGDMPLIESVKITGVASTSISTTNPVGNSYDNPITIDSKNSDNEVKVQTSVKATKNATNADTALTWKAEVITKSESSEVATDLTEATTAGIKGEITMTGADKTANLLIKKSAYAEGDVILKLTATAAGTAKDGGTKADSVYVKIVLTPDITGSTVTLKAAVNGGTSVVVAGGEKYEAPATSDDVDDHARTDVVFTTEVEGAHIDPATKAEIVKPEDGSNVTFTQETDAKDTLTMHISENVKAEEDISLALKVGDTSKGTKTVKVITNAKAAEGITVDFKSTDDVTWTKGKTNYGTTQVPVWSEGKMVVKDKAPGQSVKIPITISDTTRKWETVTVDEYQEGGNYRFDSEDFSQSIGTTRTDKGQLYLVINSSIGEIAEQRKADAEKDIDEIAPCLVTVTLTSTPEGAKAAVSTEISFELVVEKTVTGITLDNSGSPSKDASGVIKITPATSTVTLAAEVNGTHITTTAGERDQKVTWEIISKTSKSKATINKNTGVISNITADDNIITVKATSVTDKKISQTIRIKVGTAQ